MRYRLVDIGATELAFTIETTSGKRELITLHFSDERGKVSFNKWASTDGINPSCLTMQYDIDRMMEVLEELANL